MSFTTLIVLIVWNFWCATGEVGECGECGMKIGIFNGKSSTNFGWKVKIYEFAQLNRQFLFFFNFSEQGWADAIRYYSSLKNFEMFSLFDFRFKTLYRTALFFHDQSWYFVTMHDYFWQIMSFYDI